MNRLRELIELRAKLLKQINLIGEEIQQLKLRQMKEESFNKLKKYHHQGEK